MGLLSQETIELIRQFRASLDRQIEQRVEELVMARFQSTGVTEQLSIGERLDAEVDRLNITHEALAETIGVSRSSYFEAKAGRLGKKATSRRKIEKYLKRRAEIPD